LIEGPKQIMLAKGSKN